MEVLEDCSGATMSNEKKLQSCSIVLLSIPIVMHEFISWPYVHGAVGN